MPLNRLTNPLLHTSFPEAWSFREAGVSNDFLRKGYTYSIQLRLTGTQEQLYCSESTAQGGINLPLARH